MPGFIVNARKAWKTVYSVTKEGLGYFDAGIRTDGGWEDLRFPAVGVNPPGAVSDPGRSVATGCLLFDAAGVEVVVLQAQLPHSWKLGTPLVPHVHWTKTSDAAGDVVWRLQYKWFGINAVGDAEWTTLTASTPVESTPDTDEADKHLITAFDEIPTAGKKISDMLILNLARLGDDVADTYNADAQLLEFDIHYVLDSLGSIEAYTKE